MGKSRKQPKSKNDLIEYKRFLDVKKTKDGFQVKILWSDKLKTWEPIESIKDIGGARTMHALKFLLKKKKVGGSSMKVVEEACNYLEQNLGDLTEEELNFIYAGADHPDGNHMMIPKLSDLKNLHKSKESKKKRIQKMKNIKFQNMKACIANSLVKLGYNMTVREKMKISRSDLNAQDEFLKSLGFKIEEPIFGRLVEIRTEPKCLVLFELTDQPGTWHCYPITGEEIKDEYYLDHLEEDVHYYLAKLG